MPARDMMRVLSGRSKARPEPASVTSPSLVSVPGVAVTTPAPLAVGVTTTISVAVFASPSLVIVRVLFVVNGGTVVVGFDVVVGLLEVLGVEVVPVVVVCLVELTVSLVDGSRSDEGPGTEDDGVSLEEGSGTELVVELLVPNCRFGRWTCLNRFSKCSFSPAANASASRARRRP